MLLLYFCSVILCTTAMILLYHKITEIQEEDSEDILLSYKDTVRPVLTDSSAANTIRRLLIASFK